MAKMQYILSLFIYALKDKAKISVNTLFRYVYLYSVSIDYLTNEDKKDETVIIDKDLGVADYSVLYDAMQRLNETDMITLVDSNNLTGSNKLNVFVESLMSQERVLLDLNRITYFVGMISNYSEDVILSVFYNEPNVAKASNRNEAVVHLKDNRLYELLENFERIANDECGNNLDKYDVFVSWLDYVFEKYVQGKIKND